MHRRLGSWSRKGAWVLFSAVAGGLVGYAFTKQDHPDYRFLQDSLVVSVPKTIEKDFERSPHQYRRWVYAVDRPMDTTLLAVRSELQYAIEQPISKVGSSFLVPRREGSRIRFTFPPREQILIVGDPQSRRTVIEIRSYRQPSPLDPLIARLRRTLRI